MKGIILAGGSGSRLYPITKSVSKQLLVISDKPTSVLMLAGIRNILIISTPEDQDSFYRVLGDGKDIGVKLSYAIQPRPEGLAQAFFVGEDFIGDQRVCLVLGDNIFLGQGFTPKLMTALNRKKGASVFGYQVKNPESFGVVSFDKNKRVISIEEKPDEAKSNFAVTGLYFYDNSFVEIGFSWLDTGTLDSLLDAARFVETVETRQGYKIACREEIAWRTMGLSDDHLIKAGMALSKNSYGQYLLDLVRSSHG